MPSTCWPASGIPDPRRTFDAYPHQISGGMAQRVLIAGAIACGPDLLIADEPTTALDVTVQAEVLDLLRELQDELHMGVILVTHNFGVVADLADRVSVMRLGRIVETGPTRSIFDNAQHPYTQELLGAGLSDAPPRGRLHAVAPLLTPNERPGVRVADTPVEPSEDEHERPASRRTQPHRRLPRPRVPGPSVPSAQRCLDRRPRSRMRWPRRRVRLRQDHARASRARTRAGHRWQGALRGPRDRPPRATRAKAPGQRHPSGVPRPLHVPEPLTHRAPDPDRATHRQEGPQA